MAILRFAAVALAASLALAPGSAKAITFGELDGSLHPYVGALIAEWRTPGTKEILCSGTLVSPTVFVTASHCTEFLPSVGVAPDEVWVSFDPAIDESSIDAEPLVGGTYFTHPEYGYSGQGGMSDPHDLAVVVLDAPQPPPYAVLPPEGLLDGLSAKALRQQTFTAVGYGTVREDKTGGFRPLFVDGVRRYALQSALALRKSWLQLSMNPSTGNGGTCYGDSGGPHFLGGVGSNLLVSITITGDAPCRATDTTYRLDTASARAFLGRFVALP